MKGINVLAQIDKVILNTIILCGICFLLIGCRSRETENKEVQNNSQQYINEVTVTNSELTLLPEYEEEFRHIFDEYLGYYFWAENPNEVYIVRLSMDGHLILQNMIIQNNELVEAGRKITLDRIGNRTRGLEFDENNTGVWRAPRVNIEDWGHGWNPPIINFHSNRYINAAYSFFTGDTDKVVHLFNSIFSRDGQKRYTGVFTFYDYEIIEIQHLENPFTPEKFYEKIIVEMDDNGFLLLTHFAVHDTFFYPQFFINNKRKRIFATASEGAVNWNLYYRDENHIILEWARLDAYYDVTTRRILRYKIIFRRENVLE